MNGSNGNSSKSPEERISIIEGKFSAINDNLNKILTRDVISLAVLAAIVSVISGFFGITIKNSTEKQMNAAVDKADAQLKEIELQATYSEKKSEVIFEKIESNIERKIAELDQKIEIFDEKMKEITLGKTPSLGYIEILTEDGFNREPPSAIVEISMGRAKETRTTPEYVYCYARATVWLNTRIEGATIAKLISYKVTWPNSLVDILTKKDFNQRPSVINHFNKIGWNSKVKEQDADVHKDVGSRSSISYQSGRISCESAETIVTEATKLQHFDDFSVQPIFDVDFPTEIASTTLFPRKGAYVTEADIDRFFKTHLIEGGPLSEKSDSEHSTIGDFGTTGSPDASAP